jgi:hypothetical protein
MKKITIYSLSLILLLILSCNKDEFDNSKTVVKGYLLEYGSEDPLKNITGYIVECDGEVFGGGSCWPVDSFATNNDGYFYHEFKHTPTGVYVYQFEQIENYYKIDVRYINEGALNDHIHYVDPHSWIKLHVKNINPFDDSDNIRYVGGWGGGSPNNNYGMNVDFIDYRRARGNRENYLKWWVIKNGETNVYSDTVYYEAHDTIFYEILY